jgi:2-hydroxy-3-keto-5-methylthiopentenyl-1-phosphate phosphatase
MRVICSFESTVALDDVRRQLLDAFADPAWHDIENQWEDGEITAAERSQRQIALIRATDAELNAFLDQVRIDPAFVRFTAWCRIEGIPLAIVSDGVDRFIQRILTANGLTHVAVVANELGGTEGGRTLTQSWGRAGCAAGSGVCKCDVAVIESLSEGILVYVGAGRSDFCVSARADVLFARGELADYADARKRGYFSFRTFADIAAVLVRLRGPVFGRTVLQVV